MNPRTIGALLAALLLVAFTRPLAAQSPDDALALDTTGAYASLAFSQPMIVSPGNPFTIEAWVFADATDFVIASGSDDSLMTWSLRVGTWTCSDCGPGSAQESFDMAVILDSAWTSEGLTFPVGSTTGLIYGQWNHVAVTSDGSTLTFYVNGVASGSYSDRRTIWHQTSTSKLYVGTSYNRFRDTIDIPYGPHGVVDNLRFWGVERTAGEIRSGMLGRLTGTFGLIRSYEFDSASDFTPYGGARRTASTAPWIRLPTAFNYANDDVGLAWTDHFPATSSILSASFIPTTPGQYIAVGHGQNDTLQLTQSSITGISQQLDRTWGITMVDANVATMTFDLSGDLGVTASNGVMLVSPNRDFSGSVDILIPTSTTVNTNLVAHLLDVDQDSLFVTVGRLSAARPAVAASAGFGPFTLGEDVLDTFTVSNLPSDVSSVTFAIDDGFTGEVIDSGTAASATNPVYAHQMAELPMGAVLHVNVEADSYGGTLHLIEPLTITGRNPSITSRTGFEAYVLGTPRTATFRVDSLPSRTTAITMRFVDLNGADVRFIDTGGTLITDSMYADTTSNGGSYLSTASWTIGLDTLDLPLGTQLSVTVEHIGGVPGGSEYRVPLKVLAAPMSIYTSQTFGPYTSNDYTRVTNTTTPWEDVADRTASFTLAPLPPRTRSVEFQLLLNDSTVYDSSTVYSNGSQWLTSATSDTWTMTDLPPEVTAIRAVVNAQGGPSAGLVSEHALEIQPQPARIFVTPSDYDNVIRNPYDPSDRRTTPVAIRVEPSTTEVDSVLVSIVTDRGVVLWSDRGTPSGGGSIPAIEFSHDFATLYYTADSILVDTYFPESPEPVHSAYHITMIPPAPIVTPWVAPRWYTNGVNQWEWFTVGGLMPDMQRVDVKVASAGETSSLIFAYRVGNDDDQGWNDMPYAHSLQFDGASTWLRDVRLDSAFTLQVWFRTADSNAPIIGVLDDPTYYPLVSTDEAGRIVYTLFGSHTGDTNEIRTIGSFTDGRWHHLAVTYGDGSMELYVDGGLRAVKDDVPDGLGIGTAGEYVLGRGTSGGDTLGGDYFDGALSEFTVWRGRRTYDSIAATIYPIAPFRWGGWQDHYDTPGLFSWIRFDGTEGDRAVDLKAAASREIAGRVHWNHAGQLDELRIAWFPYEPAITGDGSDSVDVTTTLRYRGAPSSGLNYTRRYPLHEFTGNAPLISADRGWGPFREGVHARVHFTVWSGAATLNVFVHDSTGHAYQAYRGIDFHANPNPDLEDSTSITIDMGTVEPGSYLRFETVDASATVLSNTRVAVEVEPLVPPTIVVPSMPYTQAIVPGTMADTVRFLIGSFESDLHYSAAFYGSDGTLIDSMAATQANDSTFAFDFDVARLTPPLSSLVVRTYEGTATTPRVADTIPLTVTATRPEWFSDGVQFLDVAEQGDSTVSFTIKAVFDGLPHSNIPHGPRLPTPATGSDGPKVMDVTLPKDLPLIGSGKMTAREPTIRGSLKYDRASGVLSFVDKPHVVGEDNVLFNDFPWDSQEEHVRLDDNNNLVLNATHIFGTSSGIPGVSGTIAGQSGSLWKIITQGTRYMESSSIVSPYITIRPIIGLGMATRINAGTNDSGQWGAIGNVRLDGGTDTNDGSYHIVNVGFGAQLAIGVQALWGAASAEFDLDAEAVIADGVSYATVPSLERKEQFQIGLQLYGELVAKYLWGLGRKSLWGPDMFWHHEWGDDIPNLWPEPGDGAPFGRARREKDSVAVTGFTELPPSNATVTPLVFPQPATSTRAGAMSVVWLEQDPSTSVGTLELGTLSPRANLLHTPIEVTHSPNAVAAPRVDNFTDTTHLVAWSQSRYVASTVPLDATPVDLGRSIDIWYAVVNSATGEVERIDVLGDEFSGFTSGRLEGNPVVAALDATHGLIAWIVADPGSESSDIYYSEVSRDANGWSASPPKFAAQIPGIEHSLELRGTGPTSAAAVWINRAGLRSTDPVVMSMQWTGTTWSQPQTVLSPTGGRYFNDVDLDIVDGRGVLAVAGAESDDSTSIDFVTVVPWVNDRWDASAGFTHYDSTGYVQRPRVSINDSAIASVLFQVNNSATAAGTQVSRLDLLLFHLDRPQNARHLKAHELLSDTTTMLRGTAAAFYHDRLVIWSHETATPYGTHTPRHGKQFGTVKTNLVLRAAKVDGDLNVSDVDEDDLLSAVPTDPVATGGKSALSVGTPSPMPFSTTTSLPYSLGHAAYVTARLVDEAGSVIATLADGRVAAGDHTLTIDGTALANGVYRVVISADGNRITRGVVRIR